MAAKADTGAGRTPKKRWTRQRRTGNCLKVHELSQASLRQTLPERAPDLHSLRKEPPCLDFQIFSSNPAERAPAAGLGPAPGANAGEEDKRDNAQPGESHGAVP